MDLLSSIMNKMEKPPVTVLSKEKQEQIRKQQEAIKKMQEAEKEKWKKFRSDIESSIKAFLADDSVKSLTFPSMDKSRRQVVHDVIDAEGNGLTGHSFGLEDIDRHVVVYKEGFVPCEDELNCLRRGEVYDPVKIERERKEKELEEQEYLLSKKKRKKDDVPVSDYKEKYSHLIGREAGLSAAAATVANKSYGFVPAESKKDQRSIEQTLKDIQEKKAKRIKLNQETEASASGVSQDDRQDLNQDREDNDPHNDSGEEDSDE